MFTGIVEETGVVLDITSGAKAIRLAIQPRRCAQGLKRSDSLAVNGCCLTVVGIRRRRAGPIVEFDLLRETWTRTNLQYLERGSLVNLERPLRADSRLGGHFVTGHIDGVGRITRWEQVGQDWLLEAAAPSAVMRYMIFKGSVAIDGISLTVAAVASKRFRVWIIPHTFELTNLRARQVGAAVNLEADLLGKYVGQLVEQMHLRKR